jgi:NAD(P)-dependent dehydrogenase (short-subunit alcohol dehydrogenase family)
MTRSHDDGRTVMVTGTTSGLGRETARQFCDRGWNVVAAVRDLDRADPALLAADRVEVVELDLTDEAAIASVVERAHARFGSVDCLLNNAAYSQVGAVEEISMAQVREQFETNVFGALALIHAVLPQMRARGRGHVINVSSVSAHVTLPTLGVYSGSKAALSAITDGLARELGSLGIDVTLVEPGPFATGMRDRWSAPDRPMREEYAAAYEGIGHYTVDSIPGDTAKGAEAIVELTEMDSPPLRLIIGPYGLKMVREQIDSLLEEYARWEEITLGTG